MLQDKNARVNAFVNGLTKEERSLLERLDAAQCRQGNMKTLQYVAEHLDISDDEI
jgi:hypothetical protein